MKVDFNISFCFIWLNKSKILYYRYHRFYTTDIFIVCDTWYKPWLNGYLSLVIKRSILAQSTVIYHSRHGHSNVTRIGWIITYEI